MNKGITRKIVSTLIIALFLVEAVLPLQTYAAISTNGFTTPTGQASTPLNYDNPNKGDNPFKPKVKDFLNPQLLSQVVGCTGIVNKVSDKVLAAVEKVAGKLIGKAKKAVEDFVKKQLAKKVKDNVVIVVVDVVKTALAATVTSPGSGFGNAAGDALEDVGRETITARDANDAGVQKRQDKAAEDKLAKDKDDERKRVQKEYRENCLNGIAIQLAKNQLSAMTKHTMSWINTGFSGDPFYVKNVSKYMDDIERGILAEETRLFKGAGSSINYPYGQDFARGAISTEQASKNFAESTKQNLTSYLAPGKTVDDFANDFSAGGKRPWDAWYSLTQDDNNNPFGFAANNANNINPLFFI